MQKSDRATVEAVTGRMYKHSIENGKLPTRKEQDEFKKKAEHTAQVVNYRKRNSGKY